MNRLRSLWRDLNASLWFVPMLMVVVAILAAFALVLFDVRLGHQWVSEGSLWFGAGADGARGVLATIAGSMMTVAALSFSLTLSTLAQVSSQYTSRVLRNFMRSRTNQVVLGFFVSIFVYCLVVLRTIRGGDEGRFIPSVAVSVGMVLALVSIGVLVFFIHHIASSIQAANIVAEVAEETEASIGRLFPKELGSGADEDEQHEWLERSTGLVWVPVAASETGYVQDIDGDELLALARRLHGVVRMERGIGSFVTRGAALVSVARYGDEPLRADKALADAVNERFSLGRQRTIEQDVGFGLRQIVDIALKALSPGINDVTTAVICIDHLGALLARLSTCELGAPLRSDDERVRVVVVRPSFASFVATALDQVRIAGDGNVAVYVRLLTVLTTAATRTGLSARAAVLRQHTQLIAEAAERTLPTDHEREQVRLRVQQVERLLHEGAQGDLSSCWKNQPVRCALRDGQRMVRCLPCEVPHLGGRRWSSRAAHRKAPDTADECPRWTGTPALGEQGGHGWECR